MAQFILMYVNGPGPAPPSLSPEKMQSVVAEYTTWVDDDSPGLGDEGERDVRLVAWCELHLCA